MAGKKKFYAVAVGRVPGIYTEWFGENGAQVQVIGMAGARYKGFATRSEAESFLKAGAKGKPGARAGQRRTRHVPRPAPTLPAPETDVVLFTDGGARPTNPGPGGFGAVLMEKGIRTEFSGGFRWTTNNRMEIMACIVGLSALKTPSAVTLHSDSQYVVNAMTKGWARGWRKRGWVKSDKKPALNADLWKTLLALCETHAVTFVWVKGHAGHAENERCDQLATEAASGADLPPDTGYEK